MNSWVFMGFYLIRYWDSLQEVFWPRFEHVFRLNIQSIRECDPTKFNKEMGPHYVNAIKYLDYLDIMY